MTGKQFLYGGRDLFGHFREMACEIARLQSLLKNGRYTSKRIRRLYRKRTARRDHAMEALARDLIERLYDDGISTGMSVCSLACSARIGRSKRTQ